MSQQNPPGLSSCNVQLVHVMSGCTDVQSLCLICMSEVLHSLIAAVLPGGGWQVYVTCETGVCALSPVCTGLGNKKDISYRGRWFLLRDLKSLF